MRHKFTYILLSLGVMSLTTGCATILDVPDTNQVGDDSIGLAFTLSVQGNSQPTSRAYTTDWQATDYDAAIDLSSVKVAIFDEAGTTLVEDVTNLTCYEIGTNTYQYYGKVDKDKLTVGEKYRCVVITNSGSSVDFENLSSLSYELDDLPNGNSTANYYIPMWGMNTFALKTGVDTQDAGSITMLRASAKCRIRLSDELYSQGYRLDNLTINRSNTSGYVLPKAIEGLTSSATYIASNKSYFNPQETANSEKIAFEADPDYVSNSGQSAIVYFPEIENKEDDPATVSLTISNSTYNTTATYELQFKDYEPVTTTTAVNPYGELTRNHVYDFQIVGFTHGLDIELIVSNWTEEERELEYTDQISVNKEHHWVSGTYDSCDSDNKIVTMKTGIVLQGTFEIDSPVGAVWIASLTDDAGGDAFSFLNLLYTVGGANVYETEETNVQDTDEDGNLKTDEDGNPVYKTAYVQSNTLEGEVGKPVTLYIYSNRQEESIQHTGQLNIYVRLQDTNSTTTIVSQLSDWTIIQP